MPNRVPGRLNPLVPKLPRGWIDGFVTSNDSGDLPHDIAFAAGSCRDSTNVVDMETTSEIVKKIDVTWTAGSDQGGFPDTALNLADTTWYHLFIIGTPGGTVDAGFDTSTTAVNLLDSNTAGADGFSLFRRVGSVLTFDSGASNFDITRYLQNHDTFLWDVPNTNFTDSDVLTTEETGIIDTPLGARVEAILGCNVANSTATTAVFIYSTDVTGANASLTTGIGVVVGNGAEGAAQVLVWTDLLSTIAYRASTNSGNPDLIVTTIGWNDPRGRNE